LSGGKVIEVDKVDDAGLDKRFLRERKREKRREGGRERRERRERAVRLMRVSEGREEGVKGEMLVIS
jgi:hypothetical protein